MKIYVSLLLLVFITAISCQHPINKQVVVAENEPIVSYINSYTKNNEPILVYEHRINPSNVVRNLWHGRLSDSVYIKDAPKFVDSGYYNKDAWDVFVKQCNNDTILKSWSKNDFKFNYKIIAFKRLEKQFHRSNIHITKGRLYGFSDVLYYDDKKYAIFMVSVRESMSFLDGKKTDVAVIIMKKENGIWKLVNKVRIDPTTIFLD